MNKLFKLNLVTRALLVLFFEFVLIIVVLRISLDNQTNVEQYQLFIFGELLAVLLLNAQSFFLVAILNSICITAISLYQVHTVDIQVNFWIMLLPPIAVQFLLAVVSYLQIAYVNVHIKAAYREKTQAAEAQQQAEQQKAWAEKNMMRLQNTLELIVHKYVTLINQGLFTKIPLNEYEPALWPLISAFNSLQNRLRHTYQVENELKDIQTAISTCAELINQGKFSFDQQVHTHTALDMLFDSLRKMQSCVPYQEVPYQQVYSDAWKLEATGWSLESATTLKLNLENIWIANARELYSQGQHIHQGWQIDYFKYVKNIDNGCC